MPNTNYANFFHARELSKTGVIADLPNKIALTPPFAPATYPSGPIERVRVEPHNVTVVEVGSMHVFISQGATKPHKWSLKISENAPSHPAAASNVRLVFIRGHIRPPQSFVSANMQFLDDPAQSTPPAYEWGQTFSANWPLLRRDSVEKFNNLAAAWRDTRADTGTILDMCTNRHYQQIIGMGKEAVPLILRDLEKSADEWFWALAAITGANPVREEHRGRTKLMVSDWLNWARTQGYDW